jgi:hypothetical protein
MGKRLIRTTSIQYHMPGKRALGAFKEQRQNVAVDSIRDRRLQAELRE